ncbi:MAG: penicillin-binding transpeptidase domain-containing protein [Actinomycetota bacterium]
MNPGIRRVGLALVACFLVLAGQLAYLQVARSRSLADDPRNPRPFLRNVARDRGPIVSREGDLLARSVRTDDVYRYRRIYPPGTALLFAQVVGYQSINFGETGVERTYSDALAGRTFSLQAENLTDALSGRAPVGTVVLTLSTRAQRLAADGLAGRRGSVVVLDVVGGGVLAAYSNPTYDPNLLTGHDSTEVGAARRLLLAEPGNPLLPKPWAERYPPGSTFKTVTAAVAIEGGASLTREYPFVRAIPLPQTDGQLLRNFDDEICGGTLEVSFIRSCNTTYGQVGFDLGNALATGIRPFGVAVDPPPSGGATGIDPAIARSTGPVPGTFRRNQAGFMQDAIGQNQVAVTPLAMAMVAAGIANGGLLMDPRFVACVKDPTDRVVSRTGPSAYRRATNPTVAAEVTRFMRGVVEDPRGTGTAARIPGVAVAGKTGTAETAPGARPHAWFIAFAPAEAPRYAVAVLVENGGGADAPDGATGGRIAAPIARDVLAGLLASPPPEPSCGADRPSDPSIGN